MYALRDQVIKPSAIRMRANSEQFRAFYKI